METNTKWNEYLKLTEIRQEERTRDAFWKKVQFYVEMSLLILAQAILLVMLLGGQS
jgi:hypothetical protein